jgi:hypothetical protein
MRAFYSLFVESFVGIYRLFQTCYFSKAIGVPFIQSFDEAPDEVSDKDGWMDA